jgi:hypothetical protein
MRANMASAITSAAAITGNVGFTAGMLSLVVGTLDKTVSAFEAAWTCRSRLQVFKWRLRVCQTKMQSWEGLWVDFDNERLFGTAGAGEIQSLLQGVKAAHQDVIVALYSTDWFEDDQESLERWQTIVSGHDSIRPLSQRALDPHLEPSFFARVAMALWRNTSLEAKVKSLEHQIDALLHLSRIIYGKNLLQHEDRELPRRSEVETALEQRRRREIRIKRLWQAIDHAYDAFSLDERWAILLSPLEVDDHSFLAKHAEFSVDFVQSTEAKIVKDASAIRFHADYNLDIDQDEMALTTDLETTVSLSNTIEKDLQFAASLNDDMDLRRSFETLAAVEWAGVAHQFATWSTLLCNSNWMSHLCTCGVRSALVGGTERIATFSRLHSDAVSTPCQRSSAPPRISLGIALAEIILVRPLYIDESEATLGGLGYVTICQDLQTAVSARLSQDELLGMIKAKNHSYWLAVRYCLARDKNTTPSRFCSAQEVDAFVQNIVWPLRRYAKGVKAHHQAHRDDVYRELGLLEPSRECSIRC